MLGYVFRCGMLTRDVVRLVATLCADCNRADASQQAACDFYPRIVWGFVSIALVDFVCEFTVLLYNLLAQRTATRGTNIE